MPCTPEDAPCRPERANEGADAIVESGSYPALRYLRRATRAGGGGDIEPNTLVLPMCARERRRGGGGIEQSKHTQITST